MPEQTPNPSNMAKSESDLEGALAASTPEQSPEPGLSVWWEEPAEQDPENPLNWSTGRKWGIIATLSVFAFLTPLASSMMAPGVPQIMDDFGVSDNMAATFVVSIFVLGFATGPLLIAPLSEIWGRLPIYHVCNILFVIFSVGCALSQNVSMMLVFRFFSGFAGVAVLTCGSGTIADLMPPEQRGRAMALWTLGPLIGPVFGPVCAGFLVEATSWRWVFWVITIVSGVAVLASLLILRETYPPTLLEKKARRLRKETGNELHQSRLKRNGSPRRLFAEAIFRPTRMFALSPIVMVLCVYVAVVYGILYVLFTTFAFVYQDIYGFDAIGAGLSFIGGGVGNLLGLAYVGYLSDNIIKKRQSESDSAQPELRLHPIISIPSALSLPAGLLIYGWTADQQAHWIVPMIGTGIMGFGMIGTFMSAQTYLVDVYTLQAASVTAANTVLRSLLGALLPLCGLQLYEQVGLGWGNTILAILLLILAPVPCILYYYGARIRESRACKRQF